MGRDRLPSVSPPLEVAVVVPASVWEGACCIGEVAAVDLCVELEVVVMVPAAVDEVVAGPPVLQGAICKVQQ